jgi:8-oxo-dGTP diphosphatase
MPITGPDPGCYDAAERAEDGALPVVLVAAVAMVDVDNRVLLQQRPEGKSMAGLWELPGGKLMAGESPEAALVRELNEELGIDITRSCLAPLTFASHRYDDFQLLMPVYACRVWKGTPTGLEGQTLKWVRPVDMTALPMPPADLPLIPLLRDFL